MFDDSGSPITFVAETDVVFMLGSGALHPYELVMGPYSVHTTVESLNRGQAGIRERALLRGPMSAPSMEASGSVGLCATEHPWPTGSAIAATRTKEPP